MLSNLTGPPEPQLSPWRDAADQGGGVFKFFNAWGRAGRRLFVAGLGAACALGLGVAAAYAVRLPSDLQTPDARSDQMLLQDELPSVAAARSNAIENPPAARAGPAADRVQIDNPSASLDGEDPAQAEPIDTTERTPATDPNEALPSPADAPVRAEAPRSTRAADPDAAPLETGQPAA